VSRYRPEATIIIEDGFVFVFNVYGFVQTIIPRQHSTKKVRQLSAKHSSEIVQTVMAET
jgi:hypothetical protein